MSQCVCVGGGGGGGGGDAASDQWRSNNFTIAKTNI